MKKFLLVSLIVLALTAVFALTACASSGGSGPAEEDIKYEWFITREEGGLRAKYNQVKTKKGETFIYCYFPARGADFEKIKIDFTIDRPVEVMWQAAYQEGMVAGAEVPIGTIDKGPVETNFEKFTIYWYRFNSSEVLEASKVKGFCLKINDPDGGAAFRMTDVSFVGLVEEF
jgi:hypothetical protein